MSPFGTNKRQYHQLLEQGPHSVEERDEAKDDSTTKALIRSECFSEGL